MLIKLQRARIGRRAGADRQMVRRNALRGAAALNITCLLNNKYIARVPLLCRLIRAVTGGSDERGESGATEIIHGGRDACSARSPCPARRPMQILRAEVLPDADLWLREVRLD